MCGILGSYNHHADDGFRQRFDDALTLLAHRGPDARRTWHQDRVALGHARLAIVDLTPAAHQPMTDASGRYHIVFNGEIYNYLEIRNELVRAGHPFSTDSDTEVILEAYRRWDAGCLERFNGMFAFAIYDRQQHRLFAARDRFGVKPLYTTHDGETFQFASEMKALLALGAAREANWPQISRFLHGWGCDAGTQTVYAGIQAVPPGHRVDVTGGHVAVSRWWSIPERRIEVPRRWAERVGAFRELLEDAVRLRLRNDVDTGVCLSGGMDSSAIYGFARQLQRRGKVRQATSGAEKAFRLFSLSYPGSAVDEFAWAEKGVRYWNDTEQIREIRPRPEQFPDLLEEVIWHQEAPVWAASVVAFHALYKAIAEQGTRVILEGHGGDELLGGYAYLVRAAVRSFASRRAWLNTWRAARCLAETCNPALEHDRPAAWRVFLEEWPVAKRMRRWLDWHTRHLNRRGAMPPPDSAAIAAVNPFVAPEIVRLHPVPQTEAVADLSPLGSALHAAFDQRIFPIALRVLDRAAMAYGLESRSPLLDYRIVQYAFSLPDEDKVSRVSKHILRRAAEGVVAPEVIRRRAKMGFAAAERDWFATPCVGDHLLEHCQRPAIRDAGVIDARALQAQLETCREQGFTLRDTVWIWEALNIALWHERFITRPVTRSRPREHDAACVHTTPAR
jgi:asparagine synthase (glutamine-hydrolysing)